MPVSQKVQIDTFDFGPSLTLPTLGALATGTTIANGTASTCNEQTADSGVYVADFVGADALALIPAGTYRLRTTVNGLPIKRFVTFAGVDGELVYARSEEHAVLDAATQAILNDIPTNSELTTALAAADDAVLAAISALNNLSAAQVNAELLDVLSVDTFAELSAPPSASSSLKDKLVYLFMWARNKATQTTTERKLYADDGTTVVSTEAVSDVSGTFTKGEAS